MGQFAFFPYRLALDLGTNSIGWAIFKLDKEGEVLGLEDLGSRIFSDGRDPKEKTPLAVERRTARSMRRRRDRYLKRRTCLIKLLVNLGLFPEKKEDQKELEKQNPYTLRVAALDRGLTPFELGRALFHLNQRRGFQSNRRDQNTKDKKLSEQKKKIENLSEILRDFRTLGEYLSHRLKKHETLRFRDGHNAYSIREMYKREFDLIREKQSAFWGANPKIRESDWEDLKKTIFLQRDLMPVERGYCQLRYEEKKPRAYRALPSFQDFRIAQDLANLKIVNASNLKISRNLTTDEKAKIWEILQKQKTLAFGKIATELRLKNVSFNLESAKEKEKGLKGNQTNVLLSKPEYFGNAWFEKSSEEKDAIVQFLLEEEKFETVREKAEREWGFSQDQADEIAKFDIEKFENGTARFCEEILRQLTTLIRDQGLTLDASIKTLENKTIETELEDRLPYYAKAFPESVMPLPLHRKHDGSPEESQFGRINNPTVHIGLNQLRILVNALIEKYGKPEEIVVELVRDLKMNAKALKKHQDTQKKNNNTNKKAEELLRRENLDPKNKENKLRYRLWEEISDDLNERRCVYCNDSNNIGVSKLFSPEFEIDHILPFAISYDDSAANKVLVHAHCNRRKRKRTPWEAFSHLDYFDDILTRVKNLPDNKKWRFEKDAMERFESETGGWLPRQLTDTAYLARLARRYLSTICHEKKVSSSNGRLTGILRGFWGLNALIKEDPENEKTETSKNKDQKPEKNRQDHRHHAIDAFVIGLATPAFLKRISDANRAEVLDKENIQSGKIKIPRLNEHYRAPLKKELIEKLQKLVVSHRPDHGENRNFFAETAYGLIENPTAEQKREGQYLLVARKRLDSLNFDQIDDIVSPSIKAELRERLSEASIFEENKKEKTTTNQIADILKIYAEEKNIRAVRVKKYAKIENFDESYREILHPRKNPKHRKFLETADNLCVVLWKLPKNWKFNAEKDPKDLSSYKAGDFVLKTIKPVDVCLATQSKKPIDLRRPHPAAKLVLKLYKGDMVKFIDKGREVLCKVKSLRPSNVDIGCTLHNELRTQPNIFPKFSNNSLRERQFRKVHVDVLGRVKDGGPLLKGEDFK